MRYIIVDVEASCWETEPHADRMEIIEIGAVSLASATGPLDGEFSEFVRPVASQQLSEFCTRLTSIRQEDVAGADYFWTVFPQFVAWVGNAPFRLCSWGAYDLDQFEKDCLRHKMELPATFRNHINLKKAFAQIEGVKPMGMKAALEWLRLSLEGTHHRGIDDARNIAKVAQRILPRIEVEEEQQR